MIQGLTKEIVSMATEEMETGLQKLWGEIFYIETIVGADKIPPQWSQKKPFRQPKKVWLMGNVSHSRLSLSSDDRVAGRMIFDLQ